MPNIFLSQWGCSKLDILEVKSFKLLRCFFKLRSTFFWATQAVENFTLVMLLSSFCSPTLSSLYCTMHVILHAYDIQPHSPGNPPPMISKVNQCPRDFPKTNVWWVILRVERKAWGSLEPLPTWKLKKRGREGEREMGEWGVERGREGRVGMKGRSKKRREERREEGRELKFHLYIYILLPPSIALSLTPSPHSTD